MGISGGLGASPTSKNRLGNWLEKAKTEPIAFCDSTGPRLQCYAEKLEPCRKSLIDQRFSSVLRKMFRHNNFRTVPFMR